jgi:hypothetical protein
MAMKPTLRSYRWHHMLDESTDRMVSNWDRAEQCSHCQRPIVHVCEMSDGTILGRDCAFKTLGLTQRTIDDVLNKQAQDRRNREFWVQQVKSAIQPTAAQAAAACYRRNTNYSGPCWVGQYAEGFYAVPDNCSRQLQDADSITFFSRTYSA